MKILVTAFEPFGGRSYNPSAALLDLLPQTGDLEKLLLPVSYEGAARRLSEAIGKARPDAAVLTGLAGGRTEVCLEYAALNIKDGGGLPDNDGERAGGESVVPGAPNALFTALDLASAVQRVRGVGVPCRVSYHAGTYVCNSIYFHLLSSGVPGVFIHIPDDLRSRPRDDAPYLPLDDSLRAVTEFLSFLRG